MSLHRQLAKTHIPGVKLFIQPLDCLDLLGITWDENPTPTLRLAELIQSLDDELLALVIRDLFRTPVGDAAARKLTFPGLGDPTFQPFLTYHACESMTA